MRRVVYAVLCWVLAAPAWAANLPQDSVKTLDDALLASMKLGKKAGYQARAAVMGPAIDRTFDLAEMTRLALGSAGKALSADQLALIANAFRLYTVANYAKNFDAYNGERFEVGEPHAGGANAVVVPSRLIPSDGGQPVALDYVLKVSNDSGWKITDVLAEGAVSQLAARRTEFVGILKASGPAGLVAALEAKTKALSETSPNPAGEH